MEEQPRSFDICIVCALYEEANAVIDEFSTRCGVTFTKAYYGLDRYEYHSTTIKNTIGEPLTILVTWLPEVGPTSMAQELKILVQQFHPRFVAMTGICAGDQRKVQLGDLVIASEAYHYEEGKIIRGPDGLAQHLPATRTAGPADQVLQYARGFEGWKKPVMKMKRLFLKRSLQATDHPKQIVAPMASGMAVRADNPFSWLQEHYHRNTVALDMEAASFYYALRTFTHALVVKGVCDYADMTKNDAYHDYAARTSAVYLLLFIQEYVTNETMPQSYTSPPEVSSGAWNVPYLRNPHFTGRDELLDRLHQQLSSKTQDGLTIMRRAALTQPQVIKGLGGIGKTQIAVEYAYRSYEQGYYTHTLWINAASEEELITSFVGLAEILPAFSAKNETAQHKLVAAIKCWLEQCQQRWLLIFDNADDISLIQEYLPQRGNGSILLTTRAHAVASIGASLEVETMSFIEGILLLLRRAQRFAPASDEEIKEAGNIVVALDHFPLALDQAGAYIEETNCRLGDYLSIYQNQRKALLARRGTQITNYPDSVATTWSLSFQKVEQANPAAAELLRLCAFLAPDKIPEELIRDGATHGNPLLQSAVVDLFAFNQMLEELLKFSLVKRLAETQMLSIHLHRLVQAVLIDSMDEQTQRQWAERTVRMVNYLFPTIDGVERQPAQRYISHAQACAKLINQWSMEHLEAARLLHEAGSYFFMVAQYEQAEPLLKRSLEIREDALGSEHPDVAASLNNLALLYQAQGKHEQAEPLLIRALKIVEQAEGPEGPHVSAALTNLAGAYKAGQNYKQAESLLLRALYIDMRRFGPEHREVATDLNNLAELYRIQGKYEQAESFCLPALAIREHLLGPKDPHTISSYNNLALIFHKQGKYPQAESLYQRILTIFEEAYGSEHPDLATSFVNLALLYEDWGKGQEAKQFYQRALAIYEHTLGPEHPTTISTQDHYTTFSSRNG